MPHSGQTTWWCAFFEWGGGSCLCGQTMSSCDNPWLGSLQVQYKDWKEDPPWDFWAQQMQQPEKSSWSSEIQLLELDVRSDYLQPNLQHIEAFFGCEAEALVIIFDDSGRDSFPLTEEIERCLLLLESTESMTMSCWKDQVRWWQQPHHHQMVNLSPEFDQELHEQLKMHFYPWQEHPGGLPENDPNISTQTSKVHSRTPS